MSCAPSEGHHCFRPLRVSSRQYCDCIITIGRQSAIARGALPILGWVWKYFDPAEAPPLVLDTRPTPDRSYNSETLPWQEDSFRPEFSFLTSMNNLYGDIHAAIREGNPLAIAAASVRRQVEILERCRQISPV